MPPADAIYGVPTHTLLAAPHRKRRPATQNFHAPRYCPRASAGFGPAQPVCWALSLASLGAIRTSQPHAMCAAAQFTCFGAGRQKMAFPRQPLRPCGPPPLERGGKGNACGLPPLERGGKKNARGHFPTEVGKLLDGASETRPPQNPFPFPPFQFVNPLNGCGKSQPML